MNASFPLLTKHFDWYLAVPYGFAPVFSKYTVGKWRGPLNGPDFR